MIPKIAILDASSAIILYKAGLHAILVDTYTVVLSVSVFNEITGNPYPGSREYKQLAEEQRIFVREKPNALEKEGMGGFGAGEYDTIQLFYNGMGNFIITDDGSAARYCTGEGIPFINALLFPVVLGVAGIKNDGYCQQAMEKIIEHGHYSPEIVDYARNCDADTIQFALP